MRGAPHHSNLQQVARLLARLLLRWLAYCTLSDGVSAESEVGTLLLYDTQLPRPLGITDPTAAAGYAAGGVAFGNAVWAYGALLMLDPKARSHVEWPESDRAKAWHAERRASNSQLYPPPDVLFAAMGPFLIDSSNEPWIFQLAQRLQRVPPARSTPLNMVALGLGVNNARFEGSAVEETGLDLPSVRSCLRRALLNKNCGKNYTRTVNSFKMSESSRALIEVLERQSPGGYGVRGTLTRDVLNRHGYRRAQVLGCPSLFINRHRRLGARLRRKDSNPVMDLAMLLLVQQHEGSFVIVQEITLVQHIHDRIYMLLGVKLPDSKVRFFYRIEDWLEAMRSVDIQVGSKIHGAMASLAAETPFLLLPPSWRVQEMADSMALPALPICDWCRLTEWAANPTALGLVTLAASTFRAEEFDRTRQNLACKNQGLFNVVGLPLHPEVAALCNEG